MTMTALRISTLAFLFVLLTGPFAFAQPTSSCERGGTCPGDGRSTTAFIPLADFSDSKKLTSLYTTEPGGLKTYLEKVFFAAISLGAILAVLRLSWAGFMYMGSDLWSKKEHAKEVIQDTLLGLFLLLAVWLILNQINPNILKLSVDPQQPSARQAPVDPNFDAGY